MLNKSELQMSGEQEYVSAAFCEAFLHLKHKPIVLYGIGKNTEAILQAAKGFQIRGLMDSKQAGGFLWGYELLDYETVMNEKPVIAIIARESVVPIIYRRIEFLSSHDILIYNFKGELLNNSQVDYNNSSLEYWNLTTEKVKEKIDGSEIISFDIFDTLITRRVLEPEDVFELTERRINAEKKWDVPFAKWRTRAEKALDGPCTIEEIYSKMQALFDLDTEHVQYLKQMELKTDKECIIPREQMVEIFNYAVKSKKEVYLLSDMYYSSKQLEQILKPLGITGYKGILVSCEQRAEKSTGALYDVFLKLVGNTKCLHIGDNRRCDLEKAAEKGIRACHIFSGYELLLHSRFQALLDHAITLEQRMMLGLFTAEAFNSPFRLASGKGIFAVADCRETGYLFFGPVIAEIVRWLKACSEENGVEQLLFPSRDGYLIKEVFDMLSGTTGNDIQREVYFRTSRRAVTVAALVDRKDLEFILSRPFKGTYGELLFYRFGILLKDDEKQKNRQVDYGNIEELSKYIRQYETEIYDNAKNERSAYLKYLNSLGLINGKKQGIFDFVAGGTVQYFLEKILDKSMVGMYAATMNLPNSMYKTEEIQSAYGNIRSYGTDCNLGKYYMYLEPVLTDGMATFNHVDRDGQFVFEKEDAADKEGIRQIQNGILQFAADYYKLIDYYTYPDEARQDGTLKPQDNQMHGKKDLPGGCELIMPDKILGMLFTNCIVNEKIKKVFDNDDLYDGITSYNAWITK